MHPSDIWDMRAVVCSFYSGCLLIMTYLWRTGPYSQAVGRVHWVSGLFWTCMGRHRVLTFPQIPPHPACYQITALCPGWECLMAWWLQPVNYNITFLLRYKATDPAVNVTEVNARKHSDHKHKQQVQALRTRPPPGHWEQGVSRRWLRALTSPGRLGVRQKQIQMEELGLFQTLANQTFGTARIIVSRHAVF